MAARNYGQYCGVSTALELVGERWALLIVRDLLVGPRRYTDLKAGLPRVPTNILSTRLKELQESGVIRRVPIQRSIVYELTDFGRELDDIVLALGRWGSRALGEPEPGDIITSDSMTIALRSAFGADASAGVPETTYRMRIGDVDLTVRVDGAALRITSRNTADAAVDLEFSTGAGIHRLISGGVTAAEALERDIVRILAGDPRLLERFADTFRVGRHAVPS